MSYRDDLCPIDQEPIAVGQWFKDKFKTAEINQLPCHCINKNNGCNWAGVVAEVEVNLTL